MGCPERSPSPVGASDTGLPIAGLGGRSYAFLLDWHIRAIAGLGWYAAGVWGLDRDFIPKETDLIFWWAAVAPGLAIYLLYHGGFEILTGGTPGKRLAGVRIVDRRGRTPGIGALTVRNVLRPVDSLVFYAVGLASVLLTRHAVRIGDLAAGTLLIYANASESHRGSRPSTESNGMEGGHSDCPHCLWAQHAAVPVATARGDFLRRFQTQIACVRVPVKNTPHILRPVSTARGNVLQ